VKNSQLTIKSKVVDPELKIPKLGHSLLAPLSIQTEIKPDIPSVNIIPSSPIPTRHPVTYNPGSGKNDEAKAEQSDELKLISTLEQYIQRKRSTVNEPVLPISEKSNNPIDNIKEPQFNPYQPGPVIMKIEHIDDNKNSATNLKATEKFPVVTRRFRQLPNQMSKETIEDDEATKQAQKLPTAQLNIAPIHDLKCKTSEGNNDRNISGGKSPEQPTVNANADDHPESNYAN